MTCNCGKKKNNNNQADVFIIVDENGKKKICRKVGTQIVCEEEKP